MDKDQITKLIKEVTKKELASGFFTIRKLGDTPTDTLSLVPRKYVTRNSTTANRPTTSVLGEFYFDTTVGLPVWWNGTNYQDAAGNVV